MGLGQKAQSCLSRAKAQRLIAKAEKIQRKLRKWANGQKDRKLDKGEGSA